MRMVVDTDTGIEGEPMADVLPKIDITGYFVLYFIDDVFTFSVSFTFDVTVLCFATEAVVVNSGSQAVAGKKLCALIPRYAHHVVVRVEPVWFGVILVVGVGGITVVDPMVSPVVEKAHSSRCAFVAVFYGNRGHTAGDTLVCVDHRVGYLTRLRSVEVGDIYVAADIPIGRKFITQFGISPVLLESHISAMSVGSVVRTAYQAGKSAFSNAVRDFAL